MKGRIVSHFEVLDQLGRGGIGVIYRARDLTLDREVALKFLPPHTAESAEERQRLLREARTASRLDHPNVCTIYETPHRSRRERVSCRGILMRALAIVSFTTPAVCGLSARSGRCPRRSHRRCVPERRGRPAPHSLAPHR
ncbi:MAG: hypothetical protein AB1714_11775 [Acidobacteriota bacterium]